MKLLRIFAAVLAMAFSLLPALADQANPAGNWQIVTGEARYRVELCGDGTELCAKLIWLRSDMRTAENMSYLNKWVILEARAVEPTMWRGSVTYAGETVDGSIQMTGPDTLEVNGCRLILCQKLELNRI